VGFDNKAIRHFDQSLSFGVAVGDGFAVGCQLAICACAVFEDRVDALDIPMTKWRSFMCCGGMVGAV
jgi:hypothetical protein